MMRRHLRSRACLSNIEGRARARDKRAATFMRLAEREPEKAEHYKGIAKSYQEQATALRSGNAS